MSSLSAPQVAEEHRDVDSPGSASLRRDLDSLALLNRRVTEDEIRQVAEAVTGARRTVVIADGSYAAVGIAFAHNARLAGLRRPRDHGSTTPNSRTPRRN